MAVCYVNETNNTQAEGVKKSPDRITTPFSAVMSVNEIKKTYFPNSKKDGIRKMLYILEEQGLTISEYTEEGELFYFDERVMQAITEAVKAGKVSKLRVRYAVPTYIKFYSIWQYDRAKFRELLNAWLKTPEGRNRTYESVVANQRAILEKCWILDEYNQKKRDCDEQHIYRYKTLQAILECIAKVLINNYGITDADTVKYLSNRTNLTIYAPLEGFEPQAELIDTILQDIKYRIDIHLQLLRNLRKGLDIEVAVRRAYLAVSPVL